MRMWLRQNVLAAFGASLGILIVGWLGLVDWAWTDYDREARPAFDALLSGHLIGFARLVPSYGGSLVMRAPFVFVPKIWGGGELSTFRAAAFPCLVASGILGIWLVARLRSQGATVLARVVTLLLCAANPVTVLALESGHPEDLLGAVLCIAAVFAAIGGRSTWAGVLLGLAIANQEWAILATGPVLLALPSGRRRTLVAACAMTALILVPLMAAGGLVGQVSGAAHTNNLIFSPWQVWWFLGPHLHHILPSTPWATRLEPNWLSVAHPLIAATWVPLTLLCVWLRRQGARRPKNEALLLLVLLFLLRCMLDPWDNWYYPLPFLLALVTWETISSPRPPVLSLVASVAVWALTQWIVPGHGFSTDAQSVAFLLMALPTLAGITCALYVPGFSERWTLGRRRPAPLASPA